MENAKTEFLEHTNGQNILCAVVTPGEKKDTESAHLHEGFASKDLTTFLGAIDFEYDSGFGSQELFGTIWYTDRTWSDRREYDGSEWWEHQERPEIPQELHK